MGRIESVVVAAEEIKKIMSDRDRMKAIENYLIRTDPQVIRDMIKEGKTIPKYVVDLFICLTKLYDAGYNDTKEE